MFSFAFSVAFQWFLPIFIIAIIYWYWTIPKNLPPGPIGLPFIGSLLQTSDGSTAHLQLMKWARQYGPIYKIYLAHKLFIVLGDYDTMQEALSKQGDAFSGRPQFRAVMMPKLRNRGVINTEGELWRDQRRFTLSTLRDFGVGRPILEPRIRTEVEFLIDEFEKRKNGTAFDPQTFIVCAVSNVMNGMVFGRRFEYDDQEFAKQFSRLTERITRAGASALSPFVFSVTLARVLRFLPIVKRFIAEGQDFINFVERELNKTKATFDPSETEPTNFVHAFMKAAKERKGDDQFNDLQLLGTTSDLFVAGTETTATTLRWALLHLSYHPEMQDRIYKEICDQVGSGHLPTYADRSKLPFLDATIMETQRIANLIPMNVMHRTLAPTDLLGYKIPEDTFVVPLLSNILLNPDVFPNPEIFDPMRFIDSDGKVKKDPRLIPFSVGKRICLGESLARMELVLFLGGLLSRFRFSFPNNEPPPSVVPNVGFTSSAKPFKICVDLRHD